MIIFHNRDNKTIQFGYFHPEIVHAMNIVGIWSARHGHNVRITSGNDHTHMAGSLHYRDLAFDYVIDGIGGINQAAMNQLTVYLQSQLGIEYDILWGVAGHWTHGHLEWDIRQRDRVI